MTFDETEIEDQVVGDKDASSSFFSIRGAAIMFGGALVVTSVALFIVYQGTETKAEPNKNTSVSGPETTTTQVLKDRMIVLLNEVIEAKKPEILEYSKTHGRPAPVAPTAEVPSSTSPSSSSSGNISTDTENNDGQNTRNESLLAGIDGFALRPTGSYSNSVSNDLRAGGNNLRPTSNQSRETPANGNESDEEIQTGNPFLDSIANRAKNMKKRRNSLTPPETTDQKDTPAAEVIEEVNEEEVVTVVKEDVDKIYAESAVANCELKFEGKFDNHKRFCIYEITKEGKTEKDVYIEVLSKKDSEPELAVDHKPTVEILTQLKKAQVKNKSLFDISKSVAVPGKSSKVDKRFKIHVVSDPTTKPVTHGFASKLAALFADGKLSTDSKDFTDLCLYKEIGKGGKVVAEYSAIFEPVGDEASIKFLVEI